MSGKGLSIALALASLSPGAGLAAGLQPHRASYDLVLKTASEEVRGGEGRIAVQVSRPDCEAYALDYRFVARFAQEGETTLTDQRTRSRETVDGARFEFETRTLLDGVDQSEVRGVAENRPDATVVSMEVPAERRIELPPAVFPMQHTQELVDAAKAGRRVLETALFDGDDEAEKLLSSTAIIAAAETEASAPGEGPRAPLAGLARWRVSESFYNSDSRDDGMPIFETAFTLFENGVSDDLVLRFEGYSFEGGLATLTLLDAPAGCP